MVYSKAPNTPECHEGVPSQGEKWREAQDLWQFPGDKLNFWEWGFFSNFINVLFSIILHISRKFLKKEENLSNKKMRVLLDTEKLEFVSTTVSWIQGQDIMDGCFILNFGYEAPLPWPQV